MVALGLGLASGWFDRPSLAEVLPFWVAAIAIGALSWPRAIELEDLDPAPSQEPRSTTSEEEAAG
jgi:hypothetical protein